MCYVAEEHRALVDALQDEMFNEMFDAPKGREDGAVNPFAEALKRVGYQPKQRVRGFA